MSRTRRTMPLTFAHYADTEKINALEVFTLDHDVITGVPISSESMVRDLRTLAYEAGYTFTQGPAGWISIKRMLIVHRTYIKLSTTATADVHELFNLDMVQFEVDRFGPLTVLTSNEVLPEEYLDGWFSVSPTLLSHKLEDGESAIGCFGENVQLKSKVEGETFAVEFSLKLQPVQK